MLEVGSQLRCWALPSPPQAGQSQVVEALGDHRTAYLDYEGPISGSRGEVSRFDGGTYRPLRSDESEIVVELEGEKIRGQATLTRLPGEDQRWRISWSVE